jgi:hypothetical protein
MSDLASFKRTKPGPFEVELPQKPPAGGFAGCPSGDNEYDEAMKAWNKEVNKIILENIPDGYFLKSCEVKEVKIVKTSAKLTVEKLP